MLKVKNLKVKYGVISAVRGIDLEVNKGNIVTLIKVTILPLFTSKSIPLTAEITPYFTFKFFTLSIIKVS